MTEGSERCDPVWLRYNQLHTAKCILFWCVIILVFTGWSMRMSMKRNKLELYIYEYINRPSC